MKRVRLYTLLSTTIHLYPTPSQLGRHGRVSFSLGRQACCAASIKLSQIHESQECPITYLCYLFTSERLQVL